MTVDGDHGNDKLSLILTEVRYAREDVRANRAAIDGLRGDMTEELHRVHDRVDANVSKINRNSQELAADRARRGIWKKWTAIVGSVVGVCTLAYTLISALSN
jgi:hypothetical protein